MKVHYWSPFICHVATVTSVINSIKSINKYSKKKIDFAIIDVFKEWSFYKDKISCDNIKILNLNTFLNIKTLPKGGFFKSRITYLLTFLFSVFKLNKYLREHKPDFLIIHLLTSIPLFLMIIFNYKTRFILRISGFPKLNFFRKILWRTSNKKIYKVFCPTKLTKDLLISQNIFDINKIFVVKDPILNISEFKNTKIQNITNNHPIDKEYVISIGRLTKQKNFLFLVRAFKILSLKLPHINLVILGEGEDRKKIQKEINDNGLFDRIHLIGEKRNVYPYLEKSSFFVLTSEWEDPGFVIIEAMFSRKIVLSSDCASGPQEIIIDGLNGFLYKRNSFEDFEKKFLYIYEKLRSNKNLTNKISHNALKLAKMYTLYSHYKMVYKHLV